MDDALRKVFYDNLNLKETSELLEIWQKNDSDAWEEETFEIVQEILVERLGSLPPESVQIQVKKILDRVYSYWETWELEKAISECDRAIQMAPDFAMAYDYRGQTYQELGQLEKAAADFRQAVRLDPKLKDTWDNLKSVEKELRDIQKNAEKNSRNKLEIREQDRWGEYQESPARQCLERALDYADEGNTEQALAECEQARQTLPGIAVAYNYLGMAYDELKQYQLAVDAYLEATRLDPRFQAARVNLRNARVRLEEEQYHLAALENWAGEPEGEAVSPDEKEMKPEGDGFIDATLPENNLAAPGWLYLDEAGFVMTGWPGHRTRPGRSGLDYLDTEFEAAHIEGVMVRWLFTCKLRTHNLLYLVGMTCLGLALFIPGVLAGIAAVQEDWSYLLIFILTCPYWIVGGALLLNVCLSLWTKLPNDYSEGESAFF